MDQGRAQILMQLYSSFESKSQNIFGLVSNAQHWIPFVLTKKKKVL